MKKLLTIFALIFIGVIYFFAFKAKNFPPANPPTATATSENSQAEAPVPAPAAPIISTPATTENSPAISSTNSASDTTASAASQAPTETPSLPPETVLDNARVAIHNYNSAFGENPVGENSEITAALMGKNSRQSNFIPDGAGLRVNDKGELIDAWGTPFFFHQLSGQMMEIRSAGADRKMWTHDDLVTR
jgi:hypothetical protein